MKRGGQETLQNKMDGLDTLSAGIVYGNEDAWDKLQARMEQKPARKVAWRYWTAAAAILLLLVCISIFYKTPQEQTVANTLPAKEQETTQNLAVVVEQPNRVVRSEIPAVTHTRKTNKVAPPKTHVVDSAPVVVVRGLVPEQVPQERVFETPLAAVKQPMKVYHINELEQGTLATQQPAVAATGDNVDLHSLPTLHINDVIHQDEMLEDIRKANRASWGKRLFSRPNPFYRDIPHEPLTDEYYPETRNPFRAILNIQN